MNLRWFRQLGKVQKVNAIEPVTRRVEIPGVGPVTIDRSIDCLRQGCPRPQLLTMKAINEMEDGQVVELVSDNPSAVESIPALTLVMYSTHLATIKEDGYWRVYVRKGT